jgi:Exonuclease
MRWLGHASSTAPIQGFAAIDMETTGLSPRIDRVVEVAVIQLDRNVVPCGEFATLINPGRDIGATHIHRITARDVAGADALIAAHQMYLRALAVTAWADGVISDAEYTDLRDPAKSFMRSEAALASAAGRERGGGWQRRC